MQLWNGKHVWIIGASSDIHFIHDILRIRNVVCRLVVNGRDPRLQLYLNLSGSEADGKDNKWMRDVSKIGHWATGDLEVNVRTAEQLEEAKRLVEKAYREN